MEYYDTSLQDAIEQYTSNHELIDPLSTAPTINSYNPQSSGRIIHTQLVTNIPHIQHQTQPSLHTTPGVLMHTNNYVLPNSSPPSKKSDQVELDLKIDTLGGHQSKATVSKRRKRSQIPNENKKVKKRKVTKKIKNKIPYADNPQRYRNKLQRELGLEYQGHAKVNDKWEKVGKESKKLKGRCNCKYSTSKSATKIKCGSITDEEREKIFNSFWKLSWKEKRLYVRLMVNIKPVANRTLKKESRRLKTLEIHLKCEDRYVRVCKKMFLHTLCLSEWALKDWIHLGESSTSSKAKESEESKDEVDGKKSQLEEKAEEKIDAS